MAEVKISSWKLAANGAELPEAVEYTRDYFNSFSNGADAVADIPILFQDTSRYGTAVSVIGGSDDSGKEMLAILLPFANKAVRKSTHNLIRADFVRHCLNYAGIRDSDGKKLPVAVFSSPSAGSSMHMSRRQATGVPPGVINRAGFMLMNTLRGYNMKTVGLLGPSQGGTIALNAASQPDFVSMRVTAVADPIGTFETTRRDLGGRFSSDGINLRPTVLEAGVRPYTDALGYSAEPSRIQDIQRNAKLIGDTLAQPIQNFDLFSAMTHARFETDLEAAVTRSKAPIVVGYGMQSPMVDGPALIESAVRVSGQVDGSNIHVIGMEAARHTWMDSLPDFGHFALHAYELTA